jgi:hypothetical protein
LVYSLIRSSEEHSLEWCSKAGIIFCSTPAPRLVLAPGLPTSQ